MTETKGYFGQFGGSFVPEPIQNLLNQLEETFEQYKNDPEFIAEYKHYISLSDIVNSLSIRNVSATGGDIENKGKEQTIVTYGEFTNPKEAENVIIRSTFNGQRVRVKDIASVSMGFKEKNVLMRVNKASGYSLDVVKNENADIIKTIEEVNKYLKENADLVQIFIYFFRSEEHTSELQSQ